ncbi:MAG: SusC/RagA family TonB-linked outer membrane protein [Lewinellaceae bacterium]|nr:SusC/RagA family TonB-linked outer membrane protein [Lewinellaceae bacterium]
MIIKGLLNRSWQRILFFVALIGLLPLLAAAQTVPIVSGTVTDDLGDPLVGAAVILKGIPTGTVTDLDGAYSIALPSGTTTAELIFSYLGYSSRTERVDLSNSNKVQLDVQLQSDVTRLDEVVVTGVSSATSRKQLGNAISTVDAADLENTGTGNVLGALSGKVMGALITQNSGDPGGGVSIRLRGTSTINGSSDPLYIVDGVIVDNSSQNVINLNADAQGTGFAAGQNRLIDINPHDIERIEVINGAAAAAIYGSLASNGVVQIFTKKGAAGKPQINFSTSISVSDLRQRLDFNMDPMRFGYPGSPRLFTAGDRLTMIADLRSAADKAANPGTGVSALGGALVENQYPVTRYDYQDNIFQTALGTDNYLSIAGGTESTKYYGSISYSKNEGIIRNTDFQKYAAKLRVDQKLSEWARMSIGLNYVNSSSQDMPNGNNFFSPISTMIIIDNVWDITERDEVGNLLHVEPVRMNPLSVIEGFDITQNTNRFIGDLQFSLFPVKGLTLKYILGLDVYSLRGNTYQPRVPYTGVSAAFFPDGYVAVANSNIFKVNNDFTANYSWDISDDFKSTTTAGVSIWYDRSDFSSAEGRDLAPFVTTLAAATNLFAAPRESISEATINGYFLQESIGFKDFLFLTLAGRIDGSSRFGEDERNQFYPKASASLVLSELDFWKNASIANNWNTLKLRFSYGQAGNLTGIGAFTRFTNYATLGYLGRSAIVPSSSLGNPGIRPEQQTEIEFGADLSFLKNRLGLSVTYYTQEITDLLLDRNLSPSSGGASIIENIGEMSNKGVELMLNINPVRTKDFNWEVGVAYNTFQNEVRNIGGGRAGILLRGGGGTQSAIDGQPLGVFFGVQYARNPDGSLLLRPVPTADGGTVMLPQVARGDDVTGELQYDADGQPSGTPVRTILGDPNPDWTGSVLNEFRYKRFGLRVLFDAVWGFDIWNWNSITSNNVGASPLSEQELRGEVPRGWVAAIGGFIGPRIQEQHVEDGSFIKLREIGFTYNAGKIGNVFSNLTISLMGRNLVSFDDYTGYDPETNSAGQSSKVRGDDFGNVPIPRTFQLGLNASF